MTAGSANPQEPDFGSLSQLDASRLLELGLTGPRRPVDALIDRLAALDGGRWLESTLDTVFVASLREAPQSLIDGDVTVEQLRDIKNKSKSLMKKGNDRDTRLGALVGYFFSIASALAHHHALICSRSREELDPILLDLAAVAPPSWSGLLGRAALAPSESA